MEIEETQASLSIHVVDSANSQDGGKRKARVESRSKRPKKPRKGNTQTEPEVGGDTKNHKAPLNEENGDVQSFRHLFSFGEKKKARPKTKKTQVQAIESETLPPNEKPKFAFFDTEEVKAARFDALRSEHAEKKTKEREEKGHKVDRDVMMSEPSGNDKAKNATEDDGSTPKPRQSMLNDEPEGSADNEDTQPELYPYVDPFDTTAVAEIGMSFCRQQSKEEIEAEWEDGLREEMRRNFKVKRQTALRGRRLGAAQRNG